MNGFKHTHLLLLLLGLLTTSNVLLSQSIDFSNDNGIETSSGELQTSNSKFLKELRQLRKRGKARLSKEYPELSDEEIDRLIEERKNNLEKELYDTTQTAFTDIRKQLVEDIKKTPEKLPVSDEVKQSISEIKELEAIETLKRDSLKARDVFNAQNLRKVNKRAAELFEDLEQYKSQFSDWDKELLAQVESIPEAQLAKKQIDKMKAYKPLPEGYRQNMDQFQTNDFVKEKLESKAKELESVGESLQGRFDDAMVKMQEAKEEFPSLESLEEAPKRYNPYRDQPFLKRLKFGGNLTYVPEKPVSIDFAGNVIYPINKRLAFGFEIAGRARLGKIDQTTTNNDLAKNLLSIRSISRYQVTPALYLQANYEATQYNLTNSQDNLYSSLWHNTLLAGIGRRFVLKEKIKINTTVLYDFFFDSSRSPNKRSWVIRLGFEL
jgi:hypothetical protein